MDNYQDPNNQGNAADNSAAPYSHDTPSEPTSYPYPSTPPVYSSQYNTDRTPYYGSAYRAPEKQSSSGSKRPGAGLVVLCIVCALVFSFIGTALANTLVPGKPSSDTGGALFNTVDSGEELAQPEDGSYAAVVAATKDSVVEITTQVPANTMFGENLQEGAGSGVIISDNGYILTNNHVISGSNTIKVVLSDGTMYDATVVGTDAQTDIAIIKIDATGLTAAVLGDSSTLQVGDRVIAIGNPLGSLGGTVTEGIVSGTDRELVVSGTAMTLLQISAAVNPGNSGGGLFNMRGELVGIVNAKSAGTDIEGLGFAVPINTAKEIIEDLMTNGYVTGRPEIGISIYNITDAATAYQYGVNRYGVYIVGILAGGPAEQAGLQVGDYIVSVNGIAVADTSDVISVIDASSPGDTISLQIIRGDRTYTYDVTLREKQSS